MSDAKEMNEHVQPSTESLAEGSMETSPDVSNMTPAQMAAYIALLESEIKNRQDTQKPEESDTNRESLDDLHRQIDDLNKRLDSAIAERDALARKLEFLQSNPDMAPYLSQFADLDPSVLERFATLLRTATKPKVNSAAVPAGRITQRPAARFQTPQDIEEYVKGARTLAERQQRLKEISNYLQGGS